MHPATSRLRPTSLLPGACLLVLAATLAPEARAAAAPIDALAWMAGVWEGEQDGIQMEEVWLAPKGGTMLGVHRDVKGGRTPSFEFFRIEATEDALTYWASPRSRTPTPFKMKEQTPGKRVVFENPEHDFPQRIHYWLGDDGALHAKVEGTLNGKTESEEWTWRKAGAHVSDR